MNHLKNLMIETLFGGIKEAIIRLNNELRHHLEKKIDGEEE